jgi:hypothetical protein
VKRLRFVLALCCTSSWAATVVVLLFGTHATAQTTFSGVGAAGAANALNAFRAAIGGANNGAAPPQSTGFRQISWDDVALDGTDFGGDTMVIDPYHTVAIPPDRYAARGARLFEVYAVSGDGFATVNPAMAGQLAAFSGQNGVAPFDGNEIELRCVLAGTTTRARTRAFGAVFADVEIPNSSSIEFFDDGVSLGKFFAPAGSSGEPEFLGVLFPGAVVTDVLLTVGTDPLFFFDGITFTSGGPENVPSSDLAAVDDFVYAEPVPEPSAMWLGAVGPLGVLGATGLRRARSRSPGT